MCEKEVSALLCRAYATSAARFGKRFGIERKQSCHAAQREAQSRDGPQFHSNHAARASGTSGAGNERSVVPGFRRSWSFGVALCAQAQRGEVVCFSWTDATGECGATGGWADQVSPKLSDRGCSSRGQDVRLRLEKL